MRLSSAKTVQPPIIALIAPAHIRKRALVARAANSLEANTLTEEQR
jgi:hypothetical protein